LNNRDSPLILLSQSRQLVSVYSIVTRMDTDNVNDGLTRTGTGCFIAVHYGNSGRQRVNPRVADPVFSPLHQNCLEFFGTLP